ncbi:MAG: hypothetical protein NZZ60_03275 [Bacteroidia bacterium]|nr:hypothetical protein [Bacteroidia bacterium]MCX7652525.1 hypothetical protein [Bacteroidia bacterium]MDW8417508.1 hypothetical protein [Bacteroidia bacterium]
MDGLRLPSFIQAQIAGVLFFCGIAGAQPPLKKPNVFRLESIVKDGEDGLLVKYEVPFDGMVELRLLGAQDSVVYFFQWPSPQGKRERRIPGAKHVRGTLRYRITYKGIDYTGTVTL